MPEERTRSAAESDRVTSPPHIVGVFAHPDDEAYSAAGSLALAADRGARVTIVCATRGEAAADTDGAAARRSLAKLRTAELEASCGEIGAASPVWLDVPDGVIEALPDAASRLATALDRLRADAIVTLGTEGGYGHRDHVALTELVRGYVCRRPPAKRPRLLYAEFPLGLFEPVRRRLSKSAAQGCLAEALPGRLGIARTEAHLVVALGAAAERKRRALAAHRSQLPGGRAEDFLLPGLVEPLLVEEWFTFEPEPEPVRAEAIERGEALRWILL